MKKKLIFAMSAIVALFATSCQEEDFGVSTSATSTVAFTVSTPEIASRAYSDGTTATVLQYAVYNAAGEELTDLTVTDATINGSAKVDLQLTTGNTYSVIFWAAAPNAPYTVDFANKTMTVDYATAESNDEARDAFYKYHTFTVTGAQTETIELKRPFAQLNIGTKDYEASEKAGYVPTTSSVKVSNVYKTLKLADGTVEGDTAVTFGLADIKKDETFPVTGHEYLAMNYLLVDAEKELVDIEFTYADINNDAKTRTVGSVPVQRNYRTNIYGQLLTSDVDINIEIKPAFDEPAHELVSGNYSFVANLAELQAALDKEPTGIDHIIYFTEDIEGNVTRTENGGNIVIDGQGHKFDGGIHIWGGSNKGNETTVIRNINFETATKDLVFVHSTETTGYSRYANNVTVENCTFTATGAAVHTAAGVSFQQAYNIAIKNCEATDVHSLAQFQSYDNTLLIENVKVVNGKNGIAFGNSANVTVNGAEIVANGYGIRADGNASRGNLFVENADITAEKPIVVRKATTEKYNVKLGENVALHTNNGVYEVIFTTGNDDAALVAPAAANYSIEGAENFNVFPLAATASKVNVQNAAQFVYFLNEGKNVVLTEDVNISKIDLTSQTQDIVIDGNGKTITTADSYGVEVTAGKNITLKNAKVEITKNGDYITYAAGFKISNGDYAGKTIKLEDCEIRMANTDWAYAVTMPASVKNLNLVIDNCTLEGAIALQCWGDNNNITITDSNLICNYTTNAQYTSYCVALQGDGTYNAENNTLNISGCEFSYSGVDNYNSVIKAVANSSGNNTNTINVSDCTSDNKVTF